MTDYTPPITIGTVEIDTTPDHDGDLEIYTPDGDHFAYLTTEDQITLRDILNRIHPPAETAALETIKALCDAAAKRGIESGPPLELTAIRDALQKAD